MLKTECSALEGTRWALFPAEITLRVEELEAWLGASTSISHVAFWTAWSDKIITSHIIVDITPQALSIEHAWGTFAWLIRSVAIALCGMVFKSLGTLHEAHWTTSEEAIFTFGLAVLAILAQLIALWADTHILVSSLIVGMSSTALGLEVSFWFVVMAVMVSVLTVGFVRRQLIIRVGFHLHVCKVSHRLVKFSLIWLISALSIELMLGHTWLLVLARLWLWGFHLTLSLRFRFSHPVRSVKLFRLWLWLFALSFLRLFLS